MSTDTSYDAIIIGAGQGGGPLAGALARAGWSTALVERKHVGGTCVNEGCTPTKTMIASARVAHLARRAGDYGVDTGPISIDMKTVRQRKRDIVESFRSGSRQSVEQTNGLDLIEGEASFADDHTLEVALQNGKTQTIRSEHIVINTGARPFIPPIDGLGDVDYLDSTSIMELGTAPDHLIVLGGGYIGLEFGQMFHRFGSDVTIIQRGDQLLSHEDEDVAEAVADILRDDGIDVRLGAEATAVDQAGDGTISVTIDHEGDTRTVSGSHLLVATGRRPNSDGLNLEAAGLSTTDRGHIPVNERLETGVGSIYAIGDVTGGPAFTHVSYDDYRILRDNLLRDAGRSTEGRIVPYTLFTDPQLGRVGLSESQAREQGYDIKVAELPMTRVARALETDETRGFMKAVVDADTDQILGATVLGIEGGEVVSAIQLAMMGGLSYTDIRDAPIAHPTLAESLNNLFATIDG